MGKESSYNNIRVYSASSIPSAWKAAANEVMKELSDQKKVEIVYAYLEKWGDIILLDRHGRQMFYRSVESSLYLPLEYLLIVTQNAGVALKRKDQDSENRDGPYPPLSLGGRLEELAREINRIKLIRDKDYIRELKLHGRLDQVADYCSKNY
ncbi:MAG: hypothetical protein AABX04_07980 [Nanoarchaeota archaeon]